MTSDEQKILNEFLSKTLKIDAEQSATLYNEAGELQGLQIAYDADTARISKQKTVETNQYNRGLKEGASKIEKEVKSKYELESDLIGVELVDSIVLSKVEEATKGVTKDISKHPDMIKARLDWEKEQKQRDKEWQEKLEAKDKEFAVIKIKDKVKTKALSFLDEFKAIHNENPIRKQAMIDIYINELLAKDYVEDERGEPVAIDADGNPVKNAHGYTISLKELAKESADKYFDYFQAEQRSSSGNKESQGTSTLMPKTKEEYEKELQDPNITRERRIELVNYWNEKGDKK